MLLMDGTYPQHEFFGHRGVSTDPKSPLDNKIKLYIPSPHWFIEEGKGYKECPMGGILEEYWKLEETLGILLGNVNGVPFS